MIFSSSTFRELPRLQIESEEDESPKVLIWTIIIAGKYVFLFFCALTSTGTQTRCKETGWRPVLLKQQLKTALLLVNPYQQEKANFARERPGPLLLWHITDKIELISFSFLFSLHPFLYLLPFASHL